MRPQRFSFRIARKLQQLAGAYRFAEKQARGFGELMSLIEYDRVARWEQLRQPLVTKHDIREKR